MIGRVQQILETLVAFPTISSESNLKLIEYCRQWLGQHGIESHLVFSPDGDKANLFASIGPKVPGGVILSAHTDVVPTEGQSWTGDPWGLAERNGRLYGRGTCDMKGFIALMLASVVDLGKDLVRPVHLALSYDEEVGCKGAPALIGKIAGTLPAPAAVIVGEPTRLRVVNGHKSFTELKTHAHGRAVHSARADLGASAIAAAAYLVDWCRQVEADNASTARDERPRFEPNYTTLNCGIFRGGAAVCAVAEDAWFTTDIRTVPWEEAEEYVRRFRAVAERAAADLRVRDRTCGIEVSVVTQLPGLMPEREGPAERLARSVSADPATGTAAYCTEAGLFQQQGWSTVVCGPGDILQAHRADEYIQLSQLAEGMEMLRRLYALLR